MRYRNTKNCLIKIVMCLTIGWLLTACVGSPTEKKPEIIEQAYRSLGNGVANYSDSRYSTSLSNFNTALTIFRSADHQRGIASSCLNIAKVHLEQDEIKLSQDYLSIAEKLINEFALDDLKDHLAITKSSLAIHDEDFESARDILDTLLERKQDDTIKLATLQNSLRVAIAENRIASAKSLTRTFATSISKQKLTDSNYQARYHRFESRLSDNINDKNKHYALALTLYKKRAHRPGIASTLNEWGDDLIENDELESARGKLLRALFIRQSIEDKAGCIDVLNSLNEIHHATNDNTQIGRAHA